MPRKPVRRTPESKPPVVMYSFRDRTYQIDPQNRKVYRQFVEIETRRASEILSSWRANTVRV